MDSEKLSSDSAFRAFYSENASYVGRALRQLGVAERHVEDLAQEVFVAVHRHWSERDETRPAKPWLFGFAFRIAAGHRRRASTAAEVPTDDERMNDILDSSRDIGKTLEARDAHRVVHEALACLPIEQRAVVILHDLDEVAAPEIARSLEVPLNTVYSRLRLGRQRFRSLLVERQKEAGVETPLFGALALLLSRIDDRAKTAATAATTAARMASWLAPVAYVASGIVVGAGGHALVVRTPTSTTVVSAATVQAATNAPIAPSPTSSPSVSIDHLAEAPPAASAPTPTSARKRDDHRSADERADLDVARTALVRGNAAASLQALERHTRTYAEGHFAEEREALAVQALAAAGRKSEALTRARKFSQKYPSSLFRGAIDRAVTEASSEEKSPAK